MKKFITFLLINLCAILFIPAPAYAQTPPQFPCAFWGMVTINHVPAPVGTIIQVTGAGVVTGLPGNPVTVMNAGQYGDEGSFSSKLIVQGDIVEGTRLTFLIKNTTAQQTAEWHSGSVVRLDLTAITSTPGTGGGGSPPNPSPSPTPTPPPTPSPLSDVRGIGQVSWSNTVNGITPVNITAVSQDNITTVNILKGTLALDLQGNSLSAISCATPASPPPSPPGGQRIISACELGPSGATFDPPVVISMKFDSKVDTSGLTLCFYDTIARTWIPLENVRIDKVNYIISGQTRHFTQFALFSSIPLSTTPSASPESPVITPASSVPVVSFVATPAAELPAGRGETDKSPSPSQIPVQTANWSLITGIVVSVVLIGGIVWWVTKRRKAKPVS